MAETFNLDQARAARREARGEEPRFAFGGEEFTLPVEIPLSVAEEHAFNAVTLVQALLGEEQWKRFRALDPSVNDFEALADWMEAEYGLEELGKPKPSRGSSTSAGKSSKRTSKASTG